MDPVIKVNKTLNLIADINGEPHETIGENKLSITLSLGHLTGVKSSNYCYIAETNKYYFINPQYEIKNQTITIHLKEDILMSLKSQLLAQTCTISRNENLSNAYLIDSGYQMLAYSNIVTKTFPQGMTDESIILMTVG